MLESEGHVTVRTFLTLGTCVTTCDHSVICAWTAIKGLVCISGHTTARSVLMVKAPVTTKGNSGASFQLGHADLCGLCWHPKPYWYWGRAVARGVSGSVVPPQSESVLNSVLLVIIRGCEPPRVWNATWGQVGAQGPYCYYAHPDLRGLHCHPPWRHGDSPKLLPMTTSGTGVLQ